MTAHARGQAAAMLLRSTAHAGPSPTDQITGTDAADFLVGTPGNDTLQGLGGDDHLGGQAGDDRIDGGDGEDTAYYLDAFSGVTVSLADGTASGGSGSDTLISIEDVWGSLYNDVLTGDFKANTLSGDAGNDLLRGGGGSDLLSGGQGDDRLEGGTGDDVAVYTFADGAVQVDLQTGSATGADGHDTLVSIEDVFGSAYDDTLSGNDGSNYFFGEEGNDTIDGRAGYDYAGFFGSIADAAISYDPAIGWLTVRTPDGDTDRLKSIEILYFDDGEFDTTLFTVPSPPKPIAFSPAAGSREAGVRSDIRLTFNEPVHAGSGILVLRDAAGRVVEQFDVGTSSRVHFSGSNLVIDPSQNLERNTTYALELPGGAVLDADGNPNAPYQNYAFTTSAAVELSLPDTLSVREGSGELTIRVSLNGAAAEPVTATLRVVADSTASAGSDIAPLTGR